MIGIMEELEEYLNLIDYNELWKGFSRANYAIYNDEIFYIKDNFGIDLHLVRGGLFFAGETDERFIGNSAIKINDEYLAIWNEEYIPQDMDNKKLASLIIHEMFHCYQMENDEKRFANEILGIDYPITVENISLRILERQYLLDACTENNQEEKMELLAHYYNIRDNREKVMGSIIDYEKALESVEGTAVYVEFKALNQLIQGDEKLPLKEYIKGFTKISEENLKIRESTLNQGLLLCLIADEHIPNWKSEFFDSEQYLSDFIRERIGLKGINYNYKNEKLPEIKEYINNWEDRRDGIFDEFDRRGVLNLLEEDFQITGLDPMNIIKRDNEMIHQNFLRIRIGEEEQVIRGPVKMIIGEHFFDVKKIEW